MNCADGVFLINHNTDYANLISCYVRAKEIYPAFWIGVNFLDLYNDDAIKQASNICASGIWLDSTNIREHDDDPCIEARNIQAWQKDQAHDMILFGSVAFKYKAPVRDPARVAKLASTYFDVVTTSGTETGKPADLAKICAMKSAIGKHPLAIASGITPENVGDYLPYADCFLVATGVSRSHTELDPTRVKALAKMTIGH